MLSTAHMKFEVSQRIGRLHAIAFAASALVLVIALLFGVDAIFGINLPSQFPPVRIKSAVGLFLCGISILSLLPEYPSTNRFIFGRLIATVVTLLGLIACLDHLSGIIADHVSFPSLVAILPFDVQSTNQLSFSSSLNFALIGWAMLTLDKKPNRYPLSQAQFLAVGTALAPLATLLTYTLGDGYLFTDSSFAANGLMSMPMAVGWLSLSVAILCARPRIGFVGILTENSYAALLFRRLLLPVLIVPPILAWAIFSGKHNWLSFPEFGAAVYALLAVLLLITVIWSIISGLKFIEQKEQAAQQARRRSESDFRTLFELSPTGVIQFQTDHGRLLKVNRKFCEMTGYSESELTSMTVRGISPTERNQLYWPIDSNPTGELGAEFNFEQRCVRLPARLSDLSQN